MGLDRDLLQENKAVRALSPDKDVKSSIAVDH